MAKVKDILIHVSVETAVRKRKCHRTVKHHVSAGQVCLVVSDGMSSRNYCPVCAQAILVLAAARVVALRVQLGLPLS